VKIVFIEEAHIQWSFRAVSLSLPKTGIFK
jgi:hypothetical protein